MPAPINVVVNAGTNVVGAGANAPVGPPCPKCHSQNTILADVQRKKASAAKIATGVMTGGLSLLATGVNSKQKVTWICQVCSNIFTVKAK
jgi:hypothetical protein